MLVWFFRTIKQNAATMTQIIHCWIKTGLADEVKRNKIIWHLLSSLVRLSVKHNNCLATKNECMPVKLQFLIYRDYKTDTYGICTLVTPRIMKASLSSSLSPLLVLPYTSVFQPPAESFHVALISICSDFLVSQPLHSRAEESTN